MNISTAIVQLYQKFIGGTAPSGSASASGDISQMIKYLVGTVPGTTDIGGITANAAGSIVERLQYVTDNTGIGLKKVSGASAQLPSTGLVQPTNNVGADTYGSWVEVRAASGNAIYIKGISFFGNPRGGITYGNIQIGTGGAGSETVVNMIPYSMSAAASNPHGIYVPLFPLIAVAASTRIAVRHRDNVGDASSYVYLLLDVIDQANVVPA